jgi:hypothetical protein
MLEQAHSAIPRQWQCRLSLREIFSLLLVLVTLFALVPMPGSVGQSLTTIVKTITTPVVSVNTINSTVGTTQSRITVSQTDAYSTPFVIQPTQGMYGCIYQALRFTASKGEAISVDVKSSIPISIYIMTADDYRAWVAGSSCAVASSVLYSRQQVSTVLVDMLAPSSGDYDLVFLNLSSSSSANVSVGFQGVSQGLTTVSVPVVTGFLVTGTYTATRDLTEVQTVSNPISMLQQNWVMLGIVIVVVLVLLVFAFRRRSRRGEVEVAAIVPSTKALTGKRFCENCGRENPSDSKFCKYCGEPARPGAPALAYAPPPPPSAPMGPAGTKYCINCAAQIPAQAKHCTKCGAPQE